MSHGIVVGSYIFKVLGRGFSELSIITSAGLAVLCLFYIYTVGTYLQVRIYPLIDRVTYYTSFNVYIINELVDHIIIGSLLVLWLALSIRSKIGHSITGAFAIFFIVAVVVNNDLVLDSTALFSLPVIVSLVIYDRYRPGKITISDRSDLTSSYLAVIGIIIGLITFAFAVSSIAFPSEENNANMRGHAYDIFVLFSSFSPILLLLLITCFPLKLLIDFARMKIRRQQETVVDPSDSIHKKVLSQQAKVIYISLFMLLSIIIGVIPHLPTVNVDGQLIGVDTPYYAAYLNELKNSQSAQDFIHQAFIVHGNGDRPISLILMFAFLQQMTSLGNGIDSAIAIEYLPLLLGPSLVLVIYFLTRELTTNDLTSLLAAFLTAISFHVLIGIYAGFYANWIALIFGYLSFIFFFRFLKEQSAKSLVLYGILLTLTLLSHVYTWSIFAIVMGLYLVVSMAKVRRTIRNDEVVAANNRKKKSITVLFLILACTVAIDVGRSILTGSSGGIERDLEVSDRAGLNQFVLRWNNLTYATTVYLGGLFANFIILGLGLYWIFASRMNENYNIFLIIFLSIGILPFLFGEWIIQTRVFYNIPFQIPAALALRYIGGQTSTALVRLVPICIWLVAISIVTASNFYLVLPPEAQS